MPLPKVSKDKDGKLQSKESWMSRCLADPAINEFKTHQQKIAVCLNLYKTAEHKKSKATEDQTGFDSIDIIITE